MCFQWAGKESKVRLSRPSIRHQSFFRQMLSDGYEVLMKGNYEIKLYLNHRFLIKHICSLVVYAIYQSVV